MLPYDKTNENSILAYARLLLNSTLREKLDLGTIKDIVLNDKHKGTLGNLVEEYWFLYKPNNDPAPDFKEVSLELKVTGLIINKKGELRAKERLVLGLIDYCEEYKKRWESSHFYLKSKRLLIMMYLYENDKPAIDLIFKYIDKFVFPDQDLEIIEQDWNVIVMMIKEGKAHELSERNTLYLAASRKGAGNENDLRVQPFSEQLALQRAFSLKVSYLNTIVSEFSSRESDRSDQKILDIASMTKEQSFEDLVISKLDRYVGLTVDQIENRLYNLTGLNKISKNYFSLLTSKMLGINSMKISEFKKANICVKSIRLKNNGMPKEAMSFPYFKYTELVEQDWEDSDLYEQLDKKFLFVVYKYDGSGELRLFKNMFWTISHYDLEVGVKAVWERTKDLVANGKIDELPKSSDSEICHVRPHARDRFDTCKAPNGKNYVKKSFWLNQKYLRNEIEGV